MAIRSSVNILVLNPGSSTLKFAVYRGDVRLADGTIEHVSSDATAEAIRKADGASIEAVGIRVVHGGSKLVKPARVDGAVVEEIRSLAEIAPLHNPIAVQVIEDVRRLLGDVPIVAVFDTAFHQTLPAVASTYAVPADLGVRRYGFHGVSYSYVSKRLHDLGAGSRLIICHLGNGASVCAVHDGISVDTSMGLTPMEGLVMGTRAGDLDPGVILYLLRGGRTEEQLDELLNRRSGLLGVSGRSGDVRELEKAVREGDPRAELALEIFAYRAAKYIGAYAAVLGGVDAICFTAGIGEHSAPMRRRICERLGFLGVEIDEALNDAAPKDERRISSGPTAVWVVPTNEELEIARLTRNELAR